MPNRETRYAEVLEHSMEEQIEGMTTQEAREFTRKQSEIPFGDWDRAIPADMYVWDVDVPIQSMWRGVVIARNQTEAREAAEKFILDQSGPLVYEANHDMCCGRIDDLEIG